MKKSFILLFCLVLVATAAFAQRTATSTGAASAVVSTAATVASSDMGPALESLKANLQEEYRVVGGNTLKAVSRAVYGDYRYWPIVYLTNKEAIDNPELIEPGMAFKIYRLPFDPALPNDVSKLLVAETYLQTYERYVRLGGAWVDARRWVLLEATHFAPDLFTRFAARIEASDAEWHAAR